MTVVEVRKEVEGTFGSPSCNPLLLITLVSLPLITFSNKLSLSLSVENLFGIRGSTVQTVPFSFCGPLLVNLLD